MSRHLRRHRLYYVPLLAPLILFLLAHLVTLLALMLIKSGVLTGEHVMVKTVVTWAVYGFLPLLLCSYLCFFTVARPAIGILARVCADWPSIGRDLTIGGVYGLVMGLTLALLLGPDTWLKGMTVMGIGLAAGQGNWFFYRKWEPVDA